MGKTYQAIDERIEGWMARQHMFFVGTAPLAADGSVNLSPKGNDTLRVLDPHTLLYLDSGGSGIETVAHLRENARIVIMMCSFDAAPKIYRFHGKGSVVTPLHDDFKRLLKNFKGTELGVRNLIKIDVTRISDSCGYGVPLYEYEGDRRTAIEYAKNHSADDIRKTLAHSNADSIDGLKGLNTNEAYAYVAADKKDN